MDGSDIYLHLNKVATEEDIENDHTLEYVGQTVKTVKIRVAFCPYCGKKLASDNEAVVPQFQSYNFSRRK